MVASNTAEISTKQPSFDESLQAPSSTKSFTKDFNDLVLWYTQPLSFFQFVLYVIQEQPQVHKPDLRLK